jgi:ribonuclease VapC
LTIFRDASAHIARFLEVVEIRFVAISEREYEFACDAYEKFGRGRHAAALNMVDRHASARAKANRALLLFEGNDFSQTDIANAAL